MEPWERKCVVLIGLVGAGVVAAAAALLGAPRNDADAGGMGNPKDWTTRTGTSIRARVVDPAKKPVSGARVEVHADTLVGSSTTSVDGTFLIDRLDPGQIVDLVILAQDMAPLFAKNASFKPNQVNDLGDVKVTPGEPLAIRVVEADSGKPVAGAAIDVSARVTGRGRERLLRLVSVETDAEGNAPLRLLPHEYKLRVVKEGFRPFEFDHKHPGGLGPIPLSRS